MKKEKIVVHDEVLAKVGVALRRAAKRAREIAAQTNTPIVVFENGKVVKKKVTLERWGQVLYLNISGLLTFESIGESC